MWADLTVQSSTNKHLYRVCVSPEGPSAHYLFSDTNLNTAYDVKHFSLEVIILHRYQICGPNNFTINPLL